MSIGHDMAAMYRNGTRHLMIAFIGLLTACIVFAAGHATVTP